MQLRTKHIVLKQTIVLLLSIFLFFLGINVFAKSASGILGGTQDISGSGSMMLNRGGSILPPAQKRVPVRSLMSVLKNDYAFIFFYSNNCYHCKIFHPVLKLYSGSSGILVKAFAIGGGATASFPNSTVVAQEAVDRFFGKGAKVSVPTLFIINKNNLHAYPVSKGALTYLELSKRMSELTPKILKNEKPNNRKYYKR